MNEPKNKTELLEKLTRECTPIDWLRLKPHYNQDILITVQKDLDIINVGIEMANDNKIQIEKWIHEKKLVKPTPEQINAWDQQNTRFKSLVISPYVLMQIISH